jgi:hypothetical protein
MKDTCCEESPLPALGAAFARPTRSLTSPLVDYAGAWTAERGRCHRFVYDPDGKPAGCPAPPAASG